MRGAASRIRLPRAARGTTIRSCSRSHRRWFRARPIGPKRISITGYWWPRPEPEYVPDPDLAAFLAAGEAPIYVGFGSMLGFDVDRMLAIVLDALDGRRALLHAGWSGFGGGALPTSVHRIGPVPHRWLLPRMAVGVHPGGAGAAHPRPPSAPP